MRKIHRCLVHLVAGLAIVSLFAGGANADEADGQLWSTVRLNYEVQERFAVSFLAQGRFAENISRDDALVLRPAIAYRVADATWLGAGYDHFRQFRGAEENRFWQEIAFAFGAGKLVTGNRLRVEERWIDGVDDVVARFRYRLRCAHPIAGSAAYFIAANEVFANFNEDSNGPARGFEQNRLFGGFGIHLGERARAEIGYQWRHLSRRRQEDRNDHILAVNFFFDTKAKSERVPVLDEGHQ